MTFTFIGVENQNLEIRARNQEIRTVSRKPPTNQIANIGGVENGEEPIVGVRLQAFDSTRRSSRRDNGGMAGVEHPWASRGDGQRKVADKSRGLPLWWRPRKHIHKRSNGGIIGCSSHAAVGHLIAMANIYIPRGQKIHASDLQPVCSTVCGCSTGSLFQANTVPLFRADIGSPVRVSQFLM